MTGATGISSLRKGIHQLYFFIRIMIAGTTIRRMRVASRMMARHSTKPNSFISVMLVSIIEPKAAAITQPHSVMIVPVDSTAASIASWSFLPFITSSLMRDTRKIS